MTATNSTLPPPTETSAQHLHHRTVGRTPFCVVGLPPRHLRALHDSALANHWARALDERTADPAYAKAADGKRYVNVLGQLILVIDADGIVHCQLFEAGSDYDFSHVDSATINLAGLPYRWVWLDKFRSDFVHELTRQHPGRDADVREYAAWLFQRIRARLRRGNLLRHMRHSIARALQLDERALEIARRIRLEIDGRYSATVADYNEAVTFRTDYEKLLRENRALLPLFSALLGRVPEVGEPAARLRAYVLSQGISPRAWRAIHHGQGRVLRSMIACYGSTAPWSIIDALKVLDLLGVKREPPVWFVAALLHRAGNFGLKQHEYLDLLRPLAAPLRRLATLIELADAVQRDRIREGIYPVLNWLFEDQAACSRDQARRATWPWFSRKAAQFDARQRQAAIVSAESWEVPFARRSVGSFTVVALRTPLSVWEEGRAMRHCAAGLIEQCSRGSSVLFSVKREGRNRSVATVRADWNRRWQLADVAGTANSPASPQVVDLANAIVDEMNCLAWLPVSLRRQLQADAEREAQQAGQDEALLTDICGLDVDAERAAPAQEPPAPVECVSEEAIVERAHRLTPPMDSDERDAISRWLDDRYRSATDRDGLEHQPLVRKATVTAIIEEWRRQPLEVASLLQELGLLPTVREIKLRKYAEPTPGELAALARGWVRCALSPGEPREDLPYWFLMPVETGDRCAVIVGIRYGCGSFFDLELFGVYPDEAAARRALEPVAFLTVPPIDGLELIAECPDHQTDDQSNEHEPA